MKIKYFGTINKRIITCSSNTRSFADEELLVLDDEIAYMYRCVLTEELDDDTSVPTSIFPLENLTDDECWKFFGVLKGWDSATALSP